MPSTILGGKTFPTHNITLLVQLLALPIVRFPSLPPTPRSTNLPIAVLSAPIEHVRIRLQTQPHGSNRLYSGPLSCIRTLISTAGITHGLYRGTAVTLLREAQAYGVWFLTFEYLMARHASRSDVPSWKVALYGGLAGEVLWLASYPFDVVKSRMQTDAVDREIQKYKTMRGAFKSIWREGGMGAFWKGLGPTMVRAMPVSAGTFFTVEMAMRAMG